MSRGDVFLWVALPYLSIATFVVGHVWRYRRGQYTWTARSTQLLERRLLMLGSVLFHFGLLAVVGGHVLGVLAPKGWIDAMGIREGVYHWLALVAGGVSGAAVTVGFALLVYRRLCIGRIRVTTTRSDLVLYPLLATTIVFGMAATVWGTGVDHYGYRETVGPWFRGVFSFSPDASLMAGAPVVYQAHAVSAWLLLAAWPFTRLVHAWSVPVTYLARSPILYRARAPRPTLAQEEAR